MTVAAFRADFARDPWTGGIADHAARNQSDGAKDDGAREAAKGGVGDAFVSACRNRRDDEARGYG